MSVIENIKKAISLLEENENYYQELFELQSQTDKKIDYWLHYIELEKVPVTQSYKIIKEIKRLRNLRRQYKIVNNIIEPITAPITTIFLSLETLFKIC